MFDYERCKKKLTEFHKMSKSKQRGFIEDLLTDEEFSTFLFKPKGVPNLTEVVGDIFAGMTRPQVLKVLCKYVESEGYDSFGRSYATFFSSLAQMASECNNERSAETEERKKKGEISNKEFQESKAKLEDYAEQIEQLLKISKKVVKKEAKELAADANISKTYARFALSHVPATNLIERFRIGYYLNILLKELYSSIEKGVFVSDNVNWRAFFKTMFGKDNLAEVATFILLEGHNSRDRYSSEGVLRCWDSLTEFALKQINDAPEKLRDQMMDLYLKRISKMFLNGTYELRVDMLSIPELSGNKYPQLSNTIKKYADRLSAILKK